MIAIESSADLIFLAALIFTVSAQSNNNCDENYSGTCESAPYNVTQPFHSQAEKVCITDRIITLEKGVLTDQNNCTGEVRVNHLLRCDNPQQGPISSGFSVCSNGSLTLNNNTIFYGCLTGVIGIYNIDIGRASSVMISTSSSCLARAPAPLLLPAVPRSYQVH